MTTISNIYKLVERVGGYCGSNKHVSFSVFMNNENSKIIMINYDSNSDIENEWYCNNNTISNIYKIIKWLKDNGSKIKSYDDDPYVLIGVRFTNGSSGYWLEQYNVNPYTEFQVDIQDFDFYDHEINDIKSHLIFKGCQIENIEI